MIINQGEILAQQVEGAMIPIGTPVLFSEYTVMTPTVGSDGHKRMAETNIMRAGEVTGYETFGGPAILISCVNEEGERVGVPKQINVYCLRKFTEVIELDPDVELMSDSENVHRFDNGDVRHAVDRLAKYLTGKTATV